MNTDMDKHTPGPWEIRKHHRGRLEITHPMGHGGEHPICTIYKGFTDTESNAILIASIPEMLEVLEHINYMANSGYKIEYQEIEQIYAETQEIIAKIDEERILWLGK